MVPSCADSPPRQPRHQRHFHDVAGTVLKRTFGLLPPFFDQVGRTHYNTRRQLSARATASVVKVLPKPGSPASPKRAVLTKRGDQCRHGILLRREQRAFEARHDEGVTGLCGGGIQRSNSVTICESGQGHRPLRTPSVAEGSRP